METASADNKSRWWTYAPQHPALQQCLQQGTQRGFACKDHSIPPERAAGSNWAKLGTKTKCCVFLDPARDKGKQVFLQINETIHKMQQFELYAGETAWVLTITLLLLQEDEIGMLSGLLLLTKPAMFTTVVLKGSETDAALDGAQLVFCLVWGSSLRFLKHSF